MCMFHFEDAMYRLATFWLKTWLEPNWQAGTFLNGISRTPSPLV